MTSINFRTIYSKTNKTYFFDNWSSTNMTSWNYWIWRPLNGYLMWEFMWLGINTSNDSCIFFQDYLEKILIKFQYKMWRRTTYIQYVVLLKQQPLTKLNLLIEISFWTNEVFGNHWAFIQPKLSFINLNLLIKI